MRLDKLTTKFQEALADGQSLALGNDHAYIEPAHVLAAMLRQQDGPRALLERAGVNVAGLLSEAALCSVPLFRRHYESVVREAGTVPRRVVIHETIRAMINEVVTDLVETSRRNIRSRRLLSGDDVRALTKPL